MAATESLSAGGVYLFCAGSEQPGSKGAIARELDSCQACGKSYVVRDDGLIRRHRPPRSSQHRLMRSLLTMRPWLPSVADYDYPPGFKPPIARIR